MPIKLVSIVTSGIVTKELLTADLLRLASAQTVEVRMPNGEEHRLSKADIQALRDFASFLKP